MEDQSISDTQAIKCPFCFGEGEISIDDERSRAWTLKVREGALAEMASADVSQELFANAALACQQAHLSRLLSGVMRADAKIEGRRESDLRQIEAFLQLPRRTREDIYEYVASDPKGFVLAAKLHARLLQEDSAVPGISQLARAVLERFGAQVTLFPGSKEVSVLADTLQLEPSQVQSFFKERSRMLRSFETQPVEPAFKVPTRIKVSKAMQLNKENVAKVTKPVPNIVNPFPGMRVLPRILPTALKTAPVVKGEPPTLPRSREKARPFRDMTCFTPDLSQSFLVPFPTVAPTEEKPLRSDLDKLEQPGASASTNWSVPEGVESEESFVRGLLAHPPADMAEMTPIVIQEPHTPLPLEQFPNSPLKTPVRGLSRNDDRGY